MTTVVTTDMSVDGDDEAVSTALNSLLDAVDGIEGAKVEGFRVSPPEWAQSDAGKAFSEAWAKRPQPTAPATTGTESAEVKPATTTKS